MPLKILSGPLRLGSGGGLQIKTGSTFDFTSIPGIQFYYDASKATPVTDGTAVGSVNDSSGNSRTITQATGSLQPLYKTNIFGALPAWRFDGVDDRLVSAAFSGALTQPLTIFVVGNRIASKVAFDFDGHPTGRVGGGQWAGAGREGLFAGTGFSVAATTTGLHQWTYVTNGASSDIRRDGASLITGDAGSNTMVGITVGCNSAQNGSFTQMDFGVIIGYTNLSAANRLIVETKLKARWGTP